MTSPSAPTSPIGFPYSEASNLLPRSSPPQANSPQHGYMAETTEQAIARMNHTRYHTTTIVTSVRQSQLAILSPLTLKEFLIEVQCDWLIDNLAKFNFGTTSLPLEAEEADQNVDPEILGEGEKGIVVVNVEAVVAEQDEVEDEVDMVHTGNDTPLPPSQIIDEFPVEGLGTSKEDSIDVDAAAAASARKEEVVHVLLLEMINGQHWPDNGPDLRDDAEVLLDLELRVIGVEVPETFKMLKQRARLSSKAM